MFSVSYRTVTVPPKSDCSIPDFTNLCTDLGLEVGVADLLCSSGRGGALHGCHGCACVWPWVFNLS